MKSNLWGDAGDKDKFLLPLKCLAQKKKQNTNPHLPKPIIVLRFFKMSVIKELKKKRLLRAASLPVAAFFENVISASQMSSAS